MIDQIMQTRQRLLYLHAQYATIHSQVISFAKHEPGKPAPDNGITAEPVDWPYDTVYAAMMDGWHVVSFPQLRGPRHDGQIDLMGYEFILQKLEPYEDGK